MTGKKKGNVFFKVDIDPKLLARLDETARDVGWSRAQLFREFVKLWLEHWENRSVPHRKGVESIADIV